MLEEILKSEGYGALRAYCGTEALLPLEKHRPDLIDTFGAYEAGAFRRAGVGKNTGMFMCGKEAFIILL